MSISSDVWKSLCLVGALIIYCGLFARFQLGVNLAPGMLDCSYSNTSVYVQAGPGFCRFGPSEGLKCKKACPFSTHNGGLAGSYESEAESLAGVFYASNAVYLCNVHQTFMLMDKPPPPSFSSLV